MKRISFFAFAVAAILVVLAASPSYAWWYDAGGQVLLPNDDPVVGITVYLYVGGSYIGYDVTDSNGTWSFSFPNCNVVAQAMVDSAVSAVIQCSGFTTFPDIVLKCGGPKEPPCPQQ